MDQAIQAIWHLLAVAYYMVSGFGGAVLFMISNPWSCVFIITCVVMFIIFVISFTCCAGCQLFLSWAMKPSKNMQAVNNVQPRRMRGQ
jgi:hypothetical protein